MRCGSVFLKQKTVEINVFGYVVLKELFLKICFKKNKRYFFCSDP